MRHKRTSFEGSDANTNEKEKTEVKESVEKKEGTDATTNEEDTKEGNVNVDRKEGCETIESEDMDEVWERNEGDEKIPEEGAKRNGLYDKSTDEIHSGRKRKNEISNEKCYEKFSQKKCG